MTEQSQDEVTHELMRAVLNLKDQRFVDPSKITALTSHFNIDDIEAKIYFLRELLGVVRRFPLKIYNDDQARTRLLTAIQEALDLAIDEEEDELE